MKKIIEMGDKNTKYIQKHPMEDNRAVNQLISSLEPDKA